jgi:hypothetical protein
MMLSMKDQTIRQASDSYEAWLQTYTPVNVDDLKAKHVALISAPLNGCALIRSHNAAGDFQDDR